MGALGTGSNGVTCGAIFVPAHRVGRIGADVRLFTRPDLSAAQGVAMPLGMARYALESFLELAQTRGINHLAYEKMADAPVVHDAVARAAAAIALIEAFQHWVLSTLDPATGRPGIDTALISAGGVRCWQLAREVIEILYALCPSTEIHLTSPIQRLLRDVHVFQHQHAMAPFIAFELYGRKLCAS
jgi:alkylation response protein AidB-like acyl-CoA dehydrogenase